MGREFGLADLLVKVRAMVAEGVGGGAGAEEGQGVVH